MPGGNKMGPGGGGPWWYGYGGQHWGPPWAGGYPYWGPAMYGFPSAGMPYSFAPQYSPEMEISFLKEQAAYLEKALEEIRKRLRELGGD